MFMATTPAVFCLFLITLLPWQTDALSVSGQASIPYSVHSQSTLRLHMADREVSTTLNPRQDRTGLPGGFFGAGQTYFLP